MTIFTELYTKKQVELNSNYVGHLLDFSTIALAAKVEMQFYK